MVKQNFNYEGLGITHTDSLLIVGELTEDMVSVGWADSHLRERRKFLTHLIQQSPDLQQKYLSQFWTLKGNPMDDFTWANRLQLTSP